MANQVAMSVYLSNDGTKKYLNSILGNRTGQFITSLTSLAGSSEMLKNCDRNSILACALKAVSVELPYKMKLFRRDLSVSIRLTRKRKAKDELSNGLRLTNLQASWLTQ